MPRGVRINAVCPGTIDTPMVADMLEGQAHAMAEIMKQQSIGRLGRAEEVAARGFLHDQDPKQT
jgi:NAD(P)-dependent dehydrogenase (short-subunit alcohol dehydrogenase family)